MLAVMVRSFVVASALLFHAAASADESESYQFHCDGKDAALFEEMKASGTVGYGETWDATVCDQGLEVYAEGTTSRWSVFQPKKRRLTKEQEMLGNLVPATGAVALGVVGAAAGLMALVSRRARRSRVVEAPCPGCGAQLPILLDDPSSHGLFCPVCGTGSYADVTGKTVVLKSS
jgi:hypothetical protein